jgi:hypothetical protein
MASSAPASGGRAGACAGVVLWGMANSEERAHAPPNPLRRVWWLVGLYTLLALLVVPVFPHMPSANEFSRWALTVSLVERGSSEVSPAIALLGDRVGDLAAVDGRLYSNKAPGGSLAAVPAYALARAVVGAPSPDNLRTTVTVMRLAIATLPVLLLCIVFARQAQRAEIAPERIAFGIAVMLLGTPLFAYGLLLFAHAMVAAALFGAWLLLFGESRLRDAWRELLAGALVGLAAISDYPSVVPGAVLVACSLRRRGVVGALRIAAGALPLLATLAVYNRATFGSVFVLSSSFERATEFRTLAQSGLWGIQFPSPMVAARLLFDPHKGLLIFSPVLVLAFAAIPEAWRRLDRPAFWALVLAPLSLLLLYAGYPNWHGGWTVGARYLVPTVPFLAYLLVRGRRRAADPYLLGASVLAIGLTSLVFPFVTEGYAFPWVSFAAPLLAKGLVAPNLLHYLWRPLAITVPFLLVAVALLLAVGPSRALHAVMGVTGWGILGLLCVSHWYPDGDGRRWYIEKAYFERLDVFQNPPPPIHPGTLRQMQMERLLPPSSWPF